MSRTTTARPAPRTTKTVMDRLAEAPRKKNHRLHQSKIDRAMAILGTRTETETIEQALDLVALRDRLAGGVRNMRGTELVDVFAADR